jgi:hypothetical protein
MRSFYLYFRGASIFSGVPSVNKGKFGGEDNVKLIAGVSMDETPARQQN